VNTLPDVRGARPADVSVGEETAAPARADLRRWWLTLRWPLAVYFGSRLLLLATALVESSFRGWTVWRELANWDGGWYLAITDSGYALHVSTTQNTLGFLPLYPLLTWLPAHLVSLTPGWHAYELSGLLISLLTGASATLLIWQLARTWWGDGDARRVLLFLSFFAGTVVFSMIYTEGLLLTLVAACLLAIANRRWLLAGVLAGLSTAVEPIAVAIIPVCVVAAAIELHRHGWRDRGARRALLAPLLAPVGLLSFAGYLWIHTGNPFSSYREQHIAWQESSSPLALLHTGEALWKQVFPPAHTYAVINTNYVAGLIGAVILLGGLFLMLRAPRPSLPAIVWALGVAVLTFTSAQTPPNARMLLCAFPALVVFPQRVRGRWFTALMVLNILLFVSLSWFTFVKVDFRP
jgi:Gpi18-like mannosyltransferase